MRKYHCPKCKNETFEEVSVDVTLSFRLKNTGDGLDYDEMTAVDGGYVSRIQCESCGFTFTADDGYPIDNLEDFVGELEELGAYKDE